MEKNVEAVAWDGIVAASAGLVGMERDAARR